MSDNNNVDEANGDELEAMFARAAMEEGDSIEEMHDPLSDVVNEAAEAPTTETEEVDIEALEEPTAEAEELDIETLEEEEEPEVDFIGGAMSGDTEIEIPDEMDDEDDDEPEVDFISEAIGETPAAEEPAAEEPAMEEAVTEEPTPAAAPTSEESTPVSRLEDSILNAVELAHEAADLANDVTEVASNTTIEMRELVQAAIQQIEESQPEASSAVIMSTEMNEYMDELKKHSDAIRERTLQLRDRIESLTK